MLGFLPYVVRKLLGNVVRVVRHFRPVSLFREKPTKTACFPVGYGDRWARAEKTPLKESSERTAEHLLDVLSLRRELLGGVFVSY